MRTAMKGSADKSSKQFCALLRTEAPDPPGLGDRRVVHNSFGLHFADGGKCTDEVVGAHLRHALFARIGARTTRALIVTEGLLIYLGDDGVAALASDLNDVRTFARWLIDLASPRLLKMMTRSWGKSLAAGNAPFRFAPASGTAFFTPYGWRELEYRSTMEEAQRLNREMRMMWLWRFLGRFYPARMRDEFRRMSGVVLLERT